MPETPFYGGQAVIEGVMLRGPELMAIAVRRPDGQVVVHRESLVAAADRWPGWRWPFLRGVIALADSLSLGVRALLISAEVAGEEKMEPHQGVLVVATAVALAVGLFILLPTVITGFLGRWLPAGVRHLVEGMVRLGLLVGYIATIARLPDVRRVFAYHGAEHRVIHLFEGGGRRDVDQARAWPLLHPRCGTSFLLFVVAISVLVFAFFGWPVLWQRVALRLVLLPVVAGIAYEAIRLSGRSRHPLVKAMAVPGLALQRLTTREPSDDQVEVALAALEAVLPPCYNPAEDNP
ncbi:MAG: DUF1385 domain-containing protein [bacterium]|nr:DUF1385 domain-containing protein [bacterium]